MVIAALDKRAVCLFECVCALGHALHFWVSEVREAAINLVSISGL